MDGLKTGLIFGILMISFFAAGCLESSDSKGVNDTLKGEDSWISD
jgi:hypothetical protein